MKIGYLVNQYPLPSLAAVRREILAIEDAGVSVERFAIRRVHKDFVDEADRDELSRTRTILERGVLGLAMAVLRTGLTRPFRTMKSFWLACKVGINSDRGLIRNLAYFAEGCILERWTRESGVRHLHAHFGTNATAAAMFCHEVGGPSYSFTVHGPQEFDWAAYLSYEEKVARAAFVVAISKFCRSQLFRWCRHQHWDKIHIVRCGLDKKFVDGATTPIPDVPRLVSVGRLSEQKGQLLLVEAVQRVVKGGRDIELLLVGEGEMREEIERQIKDYGIEKNVILAGLASSDQIRDYILASRAMVLPSFAEGLPMVLMEALALRRPVISTQIAAIPELVEHGVNGWLLPAGSIDELVTAIQDALEKPVNELERMGEEGAERVRQQHNAKTEAAKLIALIQRNSSNHGTHGLPVDSASAH